MASATKSESENFIPAGIHFCEATLLNESKHAKSSDRDREPCV